MNLQKVEDPTAAVPSLGASVGQLAGMELRGSTGELVGFEVSSAEAMEGVADESVDLICAANAAQRM